MTMLTIDKATAADAEDLALRITPGDAAELIAAGLTVEQALSGSQGDALRYYGELVCLFGAEAHPNTPRAGIPWMLCTRSLDRVPPRAMASISASVVTDWRERFDILMNLVHRRNRRAIRFVQWLGFRVIRDPCGPDQEFFLFEWRRDV